MSKLLIKGAKVIDPAKDRGALLDVLIEDGKIAALKRDLPAGDAEVVDGRGYVAAPGLVDMHVLSARSWLYGKGRYSDRLRGCGGRGGDKPAMVCRIPGPQSTRRRRCAIFLERAEAAKARVYVAAAITRGLNGEALCDGVAGRSGRFRVQRRRPAGGGQPFDGRGHEAGCSVGKPVVSLRGPVPPRAA